MRYEDRRQARARARVRATDRERRLMEQVVVLIGAAMALTAFLLV